MTLYHQTIGHKMEKNYLHQSHLKISVMSLVEVKLDKVERCLARYSPRATTTNQESTKKTHPKSAKRLIFIWEKGYFFLCTTLPGRGQNMVSIKKCMFFLGPKPRFLAQKSNFCHTTPILVNGPFVTLRVTVHFPPWERFFDFPFRSYSSFRKKNPVDPSKSLPPPHCGGTVCQ